MIFFGFNKKEDFVKRYGQKRLDKLLPNITKKSMTVCSREKKCVGSIDGKTFVYADRSQDEGVLIHIHTVVSGQNKYSWSD